MALMVKWTCDECDREVTQKDNPGRCSCGAYRWRQDVTTTAAFFTVSAGRQIYRNGKPFIGIDRNAADPVVADELTHALCFLLNGYSDTALERAHQALEKQKP